MEAAKPLALVTGATGAVGSAVSRRLTERGYRVRAIVRGDVRVDGAEVVLADLADRDRLFAAAAGAGVAVHCAAAIFAGWQTCRVTNVDGTQNLVDALVAARCQRLVHLSTISAYDDAAGPTFDERTPIWTAPADPYGFTKAEAERIVAAAAGRGLPSVILRPGLVLSLHPRSRWGPLALGRARASEASILPFPEIPYVHADNLAEAVVLALEAPDAAGRSFNVVDGVGDTRAYLAAVYETIGRPPPPIPPDAPLLRYDATLIRRELGYRPRDRWREFLDGLRRVAPPGP